MVGLPARGKTYISQKVTRYLNWLGISTRVFNVGDYRRRFCGAEQRHAFFDAKNEEAERARGAAAKAALEDMIKWLLNTDGQVAIYDATNTTMARRTMIREACRAAGISVGWAGIVRWRRMILTQWMMLGALCRVHLRR